MKKILQKVREPRRFDFLMLGIVLLLMGIGIAMVYSATANTELPWYQTFWFKQITYFAFGWLIAFGILLTKPHFWHEFAYPAYIISLIGLVLILFVGATESHGAVRWISFGFIKIQPSEFAKIGYLLALSRYFSVKKVSLERLSSFVVPIILFIVPFLLVLKQPDLSTALVFFSITLMAFYWSGLTFAEMFLLLSPGLSVIAVLSKLAWGGLMTAVTVALWRRKLPIWLSVLILTLNIAGGFASYTVWNSLEGHQRSRIMTFIDPMQDPRGAGYQVIQSQLAIGSGGVHGKGFGEGSQTNLSFLPEEHTDFIFSVLGEQFGFLGGFVLLGLFFLLLVRTYGIAQIHSNLFVVNVCVGGSTILLFHIFVNIAMTLGIMPVTGLPLPFLSYGGSFVVTCMILVGFFMLMRVKGDDI
ncbi:MAG: rod shape-determining protein RodA [Fibrobacter sp.]|nr:rod shape-determining protein RodA [Fibrobacter sp.]